MTWMHWLNWQASLEIQTWRCVPNYTVPTDLQFLFVIDIRLHLLFDTSNCQWQANVFSQDRTLGQLRYANKTRRGVCTGIWIPWFVYGVASTEAYICCRSSATSILEKCWGRPVFGWRGIVSIKQIATLLFHLCGHHNNRPNTLLQGISTHKHVNDLHQFAYSFDPTTRLVSIRQKPQCK